AELVAALGKDGKLYVIDRLNMGQVSEPLIVQAVSSSPLINAATVYKTPLGTYLAFRATGSSCPPNQSGFLVSVKMVPGSPPTAVPAWCVTPGLPVASPLTTTTDGTNESIVWAVTANVQAHLRGYDGDTGATLFLGNATSDLITPMHPWNTPLVAKGRFYI